MRVSLYVLRDSKTKKVVYAGRSGDMKSRKRSHERSPNKGTHNSRCLVAEWSERQINAGTPPVCEEIGSVDLSFIESDDLRRRARNEIEKAVIAALCDDMVRRGELALNVRGNPYRFPLDGRPLISWALLNELEDSGSVAVEAMGRAIDVRVFRQIDQKHLQPTGGAK